MEGISTAPVRGCDELDLTLKENIADEVAILNSTVWCRLAPSSIHGIGVFAIRDIPKGTWLQDHTYDNHIFRSTISQLRRHGIHPAVLDLCMDRQSMNFDFRTPNRDYCLIALMNHAKKPNSTGYIALRDIKAGEEITEDYHNCGSLNERLAAAVNSSA